MRVGVPKEVKPDEYRAAMMPVGVEVLSKAGHQVFIETQLGVASGFPDEDYKKAGATILPTAADVFATADMIVKVKEPQPQEISMFKPGQIVFTYFHFAADKELTQGCMEAEIVAIAYETIKDKKGTLPLLTPMSEIAGKMCIQEGAKYLEKPMMGRGILLGGVPGVAAAHVVVLGGGIVGTNAAKVAAGLGANVVIMDVNLDRLRYLDDVMPANVHTIFSDPQTIRDQVRAADLVIGAVLIPGAKPRASSRAADLKDMKNGARHRRRRHRPGRLHRDRAPHDAPAAHLRRRRRRPLLRDQHARRRGPHQHDRALQLHAPLRAEDREQRLRTSRRRRPRLR